MKKVFFKLMPVLLIFGLLLCSSCAKKQSSETAEDEINTGVITESESNVAEDVNEDTVLETEETPSDNNVQQENTDVNEAEDNNQSNEGENNKDDDKSSDSTTAKADEVSFENNEFLLAVKAALGKEFITKQDILDIYYLAVVPVADGKFGLSIGLSDYRDTYFAEIAKEAPNPVNLIPYVKEAEFALENGKYIDTDLALFESIEIFEYYAFPINDVAFIKNYPNLVYGYFSSNGISDVSGLSDYAPANLVELDFTGNLISDWSPLAHIEDRVIVLYSAENGAIVTLKEYNSADDKESIIENSTATNEQAPENKDALSDEEAKQEAEAIGQQIAESIDWSSLFE